MRRKLIVAIPPEELLKIKENSKAKIRVEIQEAEPFFGMPRWEIVVDGSSEEIEKFMNALMRSRAGG
ncbi:MAG: hypothetical protein PWP49_1854 [Thermococcaceae archaeon]|jgi:uncharacterized repeat protein (TIGR04140 family)|uniref:TIGR04140 family protein n=1 Tax=Thermococcus TaxID=2263 RepID=UPI00074AFFA6|nr:MULTISPECIES: TIGR04140 family protein [Thermococcus]KUJ99286.1 MAG: Uncharacterized protein XD43_1052 [Thermococcales archaeon 44_46]MDK2783149.1 hypothetical protein [Thermococcaceae archaeon]MCA6212721.1 TIGR04140 family protein [Thermococcus bergensis]MCA6213042.1 TIGR04140 family protein [Thermococcus bergensis]MDK2854173.1 hypothetical protein [Thermococcaceae archaeon]